MASQKSPTTDASDSANHDAPMSGGFLSDSEALQTLDCLLQANASMLPNETESGFLVGPILGRRCYLIRGTSNWWVLQLPNGILDDDLTHPQGSTADSLEGRDCFSRHQNAWLAMPFENHPTIAELLDRWGEPPQLILDDWRNQWERMASKYDSTIIENITTYHVCVDQSGNLYCVMQVLPSEFAKSYSGNRGAYSPTSIQTARESNSSSTLSQREEGFEKWLFRRTQSQQHSKNDASLRDKTTPKADRPKSYSAVRSSKKILRGENAGGTKQVVGLLGPTAIKRLMNRPLILGLSSVALIVAAIFVWRMATRDPANSPPKPETLATYTTSETSAPDNVTGQPVPQLVDSAEAEIDYSGLEETGDLQSMLSRELASGDVDLQYRMDSFFASLGAGSTISYESADPIQVPTLDDIVRGSVRSVNSADERESPDTSSDAEMDEGSLADSDVASRNNNDSLQETTSEALGGSRIELVQLVQSGMRVQLRYEFGPVNRNSIGRVRVVPVAGWKIVPASAEFSGRSEQKIEILNDTVPGKIAVIIQSTPGRIWRFQIGVFYFSDSVPNGLAIDAAGASQLFQRLVTYQTWLNQQLGNVRQARDASTDSNARRVLLDNIKKLEAELIAAARAVDEWRAAESWIAEFFDQHQLEIVIASSRAHLPAFDSTEEQP